MASIQSMTGYGKAEAVLESGKLIIEIRTLNGKNADINIKSQLIPKEKELEVRQMLADSLKRGTIDLFCTFDSGAQKSKEIDKAAVKACMDQLRSLLSSQNTDTVTEAFLLQSAIRLCESPDARKTDTVSLEEWPVVEAALKEALSKVNEYRSKEGAVLYKDVTSRIALILSLYDEVEKLEGERITAVREKLGKALDDLAAKPDPSRFEQELIFYLEKYDINEEKVRLRQHCKYFMDTIDGEPAPGKKLGFIIQEMGREINTTGSKANHADIQKLVVRMKDELEKIREQSMNIL